MIQGKEDSKDYESQALTRILPMRGILIRIRGWMLHIKGNRRPWWEGGAPERKGNILTIVDKYQAFEEKDRSL